MPTVVLRRLEYGEEERARRFLSAFPERDLYLRGLVLRMGTVLPPGAGELFGAFEGGRMTGLFLHSATVLIASPSVPAIDAFGSYAADVFEDTPVTEVLGPASMVKAFYAAFRARRPQRPRLRLYRDDLPLLELRAEDLRARPVTGTDGAAVPAAPLRRATNGDLDRLIAACRAMTREELGIDPAAIDPGGFRRNVERKVRAGREYVWTQGGEILFRAAVSTATPEAALVEGVFTPPSYRRRGVATRGMLALCRRLLRHHAAVVLFVSSENRPATALYERMGFRPIGTYQAVYFQPQDGPPPGAP